METQFQLRDIFSLLRRQIMVIAVTLVLALTGTGLVLLSLTPVYTASAMVMVDPTRKDLLDPVAQASGLSSDSARVDGEVELVKTDRNLLAVIAATNILDNDEFGVQPGLVDRLAAFFNLETPPLPSGEALLQQVKKRLAAAIGVRRLGLTYLISIEARSRSPQTAALIANATAHGYIDQQLRAKTEAVLASRDLLQGRIESASAALVRAEESVDGAISTNVAKIVAETGRSDLLSLSRSLEQRSTDRTRLLATLSSAEALQRRAEWTTLADTLQDEATRLLVRQRSELAAQAADEPDAADVMTRLAELDRQLAQRVDAQLGSLRTRVADLQNQTTDLRTQLRSAVLSSDLPPDVLAGIYQLQQTAELARTQYQTMLSRLSDLDTQAFLQVPDSRVVAEAVAPSDPSFPRPALTLGLAGLAALGLGVGLAFLRDNYVGGFTSTEQLQAALNADQAAAIPFRRDARDSVTEGIVTAPLSEYSEAFRRLRLQVEQIAGQQGRPANAPPRAIVLLVTSFGPSEGKTSTALGLARTFALSGRRTLLIDCDMRRPSLQGQLGIGEGRPSLSDALSAPDADFDPQRFTHADPLTPLRTILGSRSDGRATDLMAGSDALAKLVGAARYAYDVVLLDAPPLGPVVDALYLSRHVDLALFVVKWAETRQQDARTALASLAQAMPDEAHILPVLTQQRFATPNRLYSGYYTS